MICEVCNTKEVEAGGFCSWHGPYLDRQMCDDCVFEERRRNIVGPPAKRAMTPEQLTHAIASIEAARKNLSTIEGLLCRDSAGPNRDCDVVLGFRESQSVYDALLVVLRGLGA